MVNTPLRFCSFRSVQTDQTAVQQSLVCGNAIWQSCHMSEYGIATSGNPVRHRCETSAQRDLRFTDEIMPPDSKDELNRTKLNCRSPTVVRELQTCSQSTSWRWRAWPITCRVTGSTWCSSVKFSSFQSLLWDIHLNTRFSDLEAIGHTPKLSVGRGRLVQMNSSTGKHVFRIPVRELRFSSVQFVCCEHGLSHTVNATLGLYDTVLTCSQKLT